MENLPGTLPKKLEGAGLFQVESGKKRAGRAAIEVPFSTVASNSKRALSPMRVRLLLFSAVPLVLPLIAGAQPGDYPNRPIRFIVSNTAGGGEDTTARTIAAKLTTALAQQIVIDNRPGAAGSIAAELAAKSPPDGYTILMGSVGNLAVNPSMYKALA